MIASTNWPSTIGLSTIFLTLLCALCGTLAWTDIRHGIIPNWVNLAIAALGLLHAFIAGGLIALLIGGCEGLAIGAVVWLLRQLYFAWRKVQGLGLGDVKFLAAAGIWVGFEGLPVLLLIAAVAALACAGAMHVAGRTMTRRTSLPFGPFLAIGLLAALAAQNILV